MSPATAAAGETPHERLGTERQDKPCLQVRIFPLALSHYSTAR